MKETIRIQGAPQAPVSSELIGYTPVYRLNEPPEPQTSPKEPKKIQFMGLEDTLGAFLVVGAIWSAVLTLGVYQVTKGFYGGDRLDALSLELQESRKNLQESEGTLESAREVLGCR